MSGKYNIVSTFFSWTNRLMIVKHYAVNVHKPLLRNVTFLFSLSAFVIAPASADQSQQDLPILRQYFPAYSVISPADVSMPDCGNVGSKPGVVQVDLDGDGDEDLGVLLRSNIPIRSKQLGKSTIDYWEFIFAVMLNDGIGGQYTVQKVDEYQDSLPISAYLAVNPPGTAKEYETGREIDIKHSSISLVFCGKSESITYWTSKGLKRVWLSD